MSSPYKSSSKTWKPSRGDQRDAKTSKMPQNAKGNLNSATEKFQKVHEKLQESIKKHIQNFDSSDEEDCLQSDSVIGDILKNYRDKELLGRTNIFLQDAFNSGAAVCLICISTVKRNDPVWNCVECYRSFHLLCIQRWSKDTVTQKKQSLDEQIQYKQVKVAWNCPNCRLEYEPHEIPTDYFCFCKKVKNPEFQTLIVPHSCGEICGKPLKPDCGHGCVLLCHPGPCPPCPKTISVTCYCQAEAPKIQRCSNKEWSCGKPCNKTLYCGKHNCAQPCHKGDCPPCPKKSLQKCLCGGNIKMRDCSSPIWQCDKVCEKMLDCGHHKCDEVCHGGSCGQCARSKQRTCPCGKTFHHLPCTEDVPTCGDTCGKYLDCGLHFCQNRCHKDKCGPCLESVERSCRCGLHKKEVLCSKPYLCETKCKQMKDCFKHPCNRKCCDGDCPPCEKPCGRTLNCKKHSCSSICHRGPCYPCNLTEQVSCKCGATKIEVPCGRKHRTRPPKCSELCRTAPNCHHSKREAHYCHYGECPPCKQICLMKYKNCSHFCVAPCHSYVTVKPAKSNNGKKEDKQPEKQSLPCPKCEHPVPVTCFGEHETTNYPCYLARTASCGRICNRLLACGNHVCSLQCHVVENAADKETAGENCEKCEQPCDKERPDGCTHVCPKPCHQGPCPPCKQMLRIRCHCGVTQPYVLCKQWTNAADTERETLQSCGNQCPFNFQCGHRCKANCHAGPCPNQELCKKKVKITCPCKRLKKEVLCQVFQKENCKVDCDEVCKEKQLEEKKLKELQNEELKKQEEIRNQRELEMFEKKFNSKKKTRERRILEEDNEESFIKKHWYIPVLAVIISMALYFILN